MSTVNEGTSPIVEGEGILLNLFQKEPGEVRPSMVK